MFGLQSLSGTSAAIAMVGIVLVEALVLYVGYGALTRIVGPKVSEAIRGE
ncbi:MAG: hypothetical protein ABEJ58_07335 [Halodesulfurarchaeum sp.]